MDVNETLARAREAAEDYRVNDDAGQDLAEAFEALDAWLSKGGYLPEDWNNGRPPAARGLYERNSDGSFSFVGDAQ